MPTLNTLSGRGTGPNEDSPFGNPVLSLSSSHWYTNHLGFLRPPATSTLVLLSVLSGAVAFLFLLWSRCSTSIIIAGATSGSPRSRESGIPRGATTSADVKRNPSLALHHSGYDKSRVTKPRHDGNGLTWQAASPGTHAAAGSEERGTVQQGRHSIYTKVFFTSSGQRNVLRLGLATSPSMATLDEKIPENQSLGSASAPPAAPSRAASATGAAADQPRFAPGFLGVTETKGFSPCDSSPATRNGSGSCSDRDQLKRAGHNLSQRATITGKRRAVVVELKRSDEGLNKLAGLGARLGPESVHVGGRASISTPQPPSVFYSPDLMQNITTATIPTTARFPAPPPLTHQRPFPHNVPTPASVTAPLSASPSLAPTSTAIPLPFNINKFPFIRPPPPLPFTPPRLDPMPGPPLSSSELSSLVDRHPNDLASAPPTFGSDLLSMPNPDYAEGIDDAEVKSIASGVSEGSSTQQQQQQQQGSGSGVPTKRRSYNKTAPIGFSKEEVLGVWTSALTSGFKPVAGNGSEIEFVTRTVYAESLAQGNRIPGSEVTLSGNNALGENDSSSGKESGDREKMGEKQQAQSLSAQQTEQQEQDHHQQQEIEVQGEIISVLDGNGHGWTRHTRVYGGGPCLACRLARERDPTIPGGFYGENVPVEERRY